MFKGHGAFSYLVLLIIQYFYCSRDDPINITSGDIYTFVSDLAFAKAETTTLERHF
ncbi:hypothetical protein LX97_03381 [Nonlabens dokdonensis]|uniref:Uncharacterized protein n=2 Tax=Nonlabens dokdonensis TaxID=328515 RepID=L7W5R8_NONDD|nr:hypothetical protein [Nonlabens dokdonensis]AGC77015.1 hypothetical protein DDD_1888 [Nonlabens dokdonensis DSW-6]PZX36916.1 hypothetical protein LX97_03381 [Nonlabens dokdonensis]